LPTLRTTDLSADLRAEHLARLKATSPESPLDILVVGGGSSGVGAAFDAATRGLDVGLVEARDWASGTSSRSSRLMHGGLRYLEMLDVKLVYEALRERDLLLTKTAPHLVRPLRFVFPFFHKVIDRGFIGAGVTMYDAMQSLGRKRAVAGHRHLTRRAMAATIPALDDEKIVGAVEYADAQFDDARLAMMLVRSAVDHGALAANYTQVVGYLKDDDGRVTGARVREELTGEEFDVHARATILAGGVWTGQQQDLAGAEGGLEVLASKGVHITVAKDRIEADPHTGVITKTEKSVLFVIPWDEYWVIGTTDTPWRQDVAHPAATADDIDYVIEHANAILKQDLTREDVIATYAGLRPLLQPVKSADDGGSTKISREHTVTEVTPGLTAVAGGKWTTYRAMAEDVVDFVVRETHPTRPSLTESVPVLGGLGYAEIADRAEEIARRHGFDEVRTDRLLSRYGTVLDHVLALIAEDPELGRPLEAAPRYLRAEIAYAARAEGVVHLDDVLERRTRLSTEVADRGVAAAEEVAAILAAELGWDEERRSAETARYRALMDARLRGEQTESDAAAAQALAAADTDPTG
jgi:glycerol-3-phosphate dehydrogenase